MRIATLTVCALLLGCQQRSEVVVFYATSLSGVFTELADGLKGAQPRLTVRLEPSGSLVAARKISEQRLRADVVAVADDAILRQLIVPTYAPRSVLFATNELVLAHLAHSKGTDEITGENWAQLITRDGVRLGRANEDLAPLGYHTLAAWQLAEQALAQPELGKRLEAACAKEHVVSDEAELLALLEAKAIDYAFVFRSSAEEHRLKVTTLPGSINLSNLALAGDYARANVEVLLRSGEPKARVQGRPITYGLAVLTGAPNPAGAKLFVDALMSDVGRRTLERHGFTPVGGR